MKDSRLAELFLQLSKKECLEIEKALESPFFNQRKELITLWHLLSQTKEIPSKETVFKALFPTEKYDAQKIYFLMSWLHGLIERVLFILQIEEKEINKNLVLSELYRKKDLTKHFQHSLSDAKHKQQKIGKQDAVCFRENYEMELQQYEYSKHNRTVAQNLQNLHNALDYSYMIEKLQHACIAISHQTVYQTEYNTGLLPYIIQYIEKHEETLDVPTLKIYYYCYLSLTKPSEKAHFEAFKGLIVTYFNLFRTNDIRDLYLLAINYCIKKHNAGDESFAHIGLELYKKALIEGFLLENNTISRFAYRNIVAWALLFEEFAWTENFINDYKNRLERTYRDSMYSFCLSKLEYSRKNYQAAMLLLQRAEYRDILLALAAKTILMKIYYELDEYDVLEAHLSSMRAYIKRKRVLGYHKTNYLNIINFTQKLMLAENNKQKINDLREAIEKAEVLTEKEWLLDQL